MSEKRIECPLCRTGTYPHFGYTGSGVCDHCGAEWTYDETDTLTDNAMRALWEKIPRWIPISERLPDEDQLVLVFDPELADLGLATYTKSDGWLGECVALYEPTHWMPLPPTPRTSK